MVRWAIKIMVWAWLPLAVGTSLCLEAANAPVKTPLSKSKAATRKNPNSKSVSPKKASPSKNQSVKSSLSTIAPKANHTKVETAQTTPASATQKLNGAGLYLKAREYFAAGRYADAIKYAAASQRRSPNTKIPTALMAQSYYRLGKTARAAKLFLQIPLSDLPKEAAVDYLFTMYGARRYRDVIKSYQIVPDNHPYKDITQFYTGVALLEFKLYRKAQQMLRNASKLPPSLKSQRRRLMSDLDDIIERDRQGLFDQSQMYVYPTQQAYIPPAPMPPEAPAPLLPGGVPSGEPAKAPPPAPPESATLFAVNTTLGWVQTATRQDYHGYKQTQSDDRKPTATLGLGIKHLGKPRSFGAQPSFDLNFSPSYSHSESTKTSSSLVADASDPTAVQNVTTKTETASYSLTNTYGISGLYPLNDPIDIGAGYSEKHDHAKANMKNDNATATTSVKVVAEFKPMKLDLMWDNSAFNSKQAPETSKSNTTIKANLTHNGENATTTLNVTNGSNSKPKLDSGIKSTMAVDVNWVRNLGDFSLGIGGNKTDRVRIELGAAGQALSEMSAKVDGSYNLSFGVAVVATGSYQQLSNLVVLKGSGDGDDTAPEGLANGTAKKFLLKLTVSPVSFVSLSASYDYTDRALSIGEPTLQKRMMLDNWSEQTVTRLGVNVNYSF